MDPNRLTQKCQEALHAAQTLAVRRSHQEVDVEHLLAALLDQPEGLLRGSSIRWTSRTERMKAELERELDRRPQVAGPGAEPGKVYLTQRLSQVLAQAEDEAKRLKDEYVSVEHLVLAMLDEGPSSPAGRIFHEPGPYARPVPVGPGVGARQPARHERHARGHLRGPQAIRPRPRRGSADRPARPRHRPRRRDPPRHTHPLPQDQEQPRPHRRAGRRQDRHRRGPRPAHRPRRRAGGAEGQDHLRPRHGRPGGRGEVSRRVRGTPEGRPPGNQAVRGPHPPLHRRTPHHRRRRQGRRAPWTPATC